MSTFIKAYEKLLAARCRTLPTVLRDVDLNGTVCPLVLCSEKPEGTSLPACGPVFACFAPEGPEEALQLAETVGPALQARLAEEADEFEDLNALVLLSRNESERKTLSEALRPRAQQLTEGWEPAAVFTDSLSLIRGEENFDDFFIRTAGGEQTLIDFDGNKPLGRFKCG